MNRHNDDWADHSAVNHNAHSVMFIDLLELRRGEFVASVPFCGEGADRLWVDARREVPLVV